MLEPRGTEADTAIGGMSKPFKTPDNKRRKKDGRYRTLGVLCQAMVGLTIVLELKNDTEVTGVVFESDQDMNMTLSGANRGVRCVNPRGVVSSHDEMFVAGRMIRYIHVPDEVEIASMLTNHVRARTIHFCLSCVTVPPVRLFEQLRVLERAQQEYKRQMLKT